MPRGCRAGDSLHRCVECHRIQSDVRRQFAQHRHVRDASSLDVMRALQAVQHVEPAARRLLCGEDRRDRRRGIHHRRGVAQQAVEVRVAERLSADLCDTAIMRYDVIAPACIDAAPVGAAHHPARMQGDGQARNRTRGVDQRCGGVAPAA
ncbi:hypothetical protein ASD14_00045 [Lysobacter sp. Root494]|nr:hypothetical protein ASD14_00045 [Lysobacter sp. Root494]